MPTDITNLHRGLEILKKYNLDPDVGFDLSIEQIIVNVGVELSSEDVCEMHSYSWFGVMDRKSWRITVKTITW